MIPASDRALVVRATVPAAEAELAADALWAAGAAGVEERSGDGPTGDVVLVAAPPVGGDAAALLAAVAGRWPAELVPVDLGAALDAWRDHARPVRVGPIVVRPPWVPPPADAGPSEIDLVVDPGRAFGSGAHASTRLALAALADVVRAGDRVLDLGCGSGVLAVAAARLGAGAVTAVDLDPEAVTATRDNAERNGVADRVLAVEGDAARVTVVDGPFDVVVANLLLPDLTAAAPTVSAAGAPGSTVVLAGPLVEQETAALAAYRAVGLTAVRPPHRDDGWTALVLSDVTGNAAAEV
jgi:ribosomal protein L11 methyltransferase